MFVGKITDLLKPVAVFHPADEEGPESDDEEEEDDNDVSLPLSPLDTDKLMLFTIVLC